MESPNDINERINSVFFCTLTKTRPAATTKPNEWSQSGFCSWSSSPPSSACSSSVSGKCDCFSRGLFHWHFGHATPSHAMIICLIITSWSALSCAPGGLTVGLFHVSSSVHRAIEDCRTSCFPAFDLPFGAVAHWDWSFVVDLLLAIWPDNFKVQPGLQLLWRTRR